jgi:superfamily II DNA or RNA helicase
MIINSAHSEIFYEETSADYFKHFGLIIFDECHLYTTTRCMNLFRICQVKYLLGLSATPNYHQSLTKILEFNLGPIIDLTTIKKQLISSWTINVKMIFYHGPTEKTLPLVDTHGNYSYTKMLELLHSDEKRNEILINEIDLLYKDGYNIYVFSMRREHTKGLKETLINKYGANNVAEDYSTLIGGAKKQEIYDAIQKARIIFTTYQYSSCGVSIIKMNACIFASPKKNNFEQIIGRILRLGSDTSVERKIIDLIDADTFLKSQYKERKKIYKLYDANITKENIVS